MKVVEVKGEIIELPDAEVGYMGVTTDAVWAATSRGLVRLDPKTLAVETIDTVGRFGLAAAPGAVWTTDFENVSRFSVGKKAAPTVEFPLVGNPNGVAIFGNTVWIAQHRRGSVTRVIEPSGQVVAQIEVGPAGRSGPQGVAADSTSAWVGIPNSRSIVHIDAPTNKVVATIPTTTSPCGGIALQADAVWVSSCFDDHLVVRVDPKANKNVVEIDVGGPNGGAVLVDSYPWFPVGNRLVRIDPATNRIDRVLEFADEGFEAFGSTIGFGAVWIGATNGHIARISTQDVAK